MNIASHLDVAKRVRGSKKKKVNPLSKKKNWTVQRNQRFVSALTVRPRVVQLPANCLPTGLRRLCQLHVLQAFVSATAWRQTPSPLQWHYLRVGHELAAQFCHRQLLDSLFRRVGLLSVHAGGCLLSALAPSSVCRCSGTHGVIQRLSFQHTAHTAYHAHHAHALRFKQ